MRSDPAPGAAVSSPTDELARLRAEIAKEEVELAHIEENVEMRAAQLSYLNAEYIANISRVEHYYEPRLLPLREVTHAAGEKQRFIEEQIAWLERKVVEQDRCATENGTFHETRDMRPAAEELMKAAKQRLLRAYAEITACPADALRVLVNYENPPDAAVETMFMVLRLRGEADRNGPIPEATKESGAQPAAATASTSASVAAAAVRMPPVGSPEERARLLSAAVASWPLATILVSHNYFTNFFELRSEGMLNRKEVLEPELMMALERFCAGASHTVEELYKCSVPIGCLGEWLFAIRDIYRVRMVTAPTLLKSAANTSVDGLQRIHDTLEAITFGKGDLPAHLLSSNPTDSAAVGAVAADGEGSAVAVAVAAEEAPADATAPTSSGATEADADVLVKYQQCKQRLAAITHPSAVNREAISRLHHRLRQLDEESSEAREAEANLVAEMEAKKAEVRANYDDTMLPLHEQLETQTDAFVARLTGEAAKAAAA